MAGFLVHPVISWNSQMPLLCVPYLVTQGSNQAFQVMLLVESHLFLFIFLLQLHLQLTELWTHRTDVSTLR